ISCIGRGSPSHQNRGSAMTVATSSIQRPGTARPQHPQLPPVRRLAASLALAMLGGAFAAAPAVAQEQGEDASASAQTAVSLDTVTVTGSRLMRKDLSAPSPTTVVSREEIAHSGSATIETVLNEFPQLAA